MFEPIVEQPRKYDSPVGDFSTLVKNGDDTFTRTMTDQRVYQYDTAGRLVSMTDRNGNQTQHIYVGDQLTTIIDPVGLETTFSYTGNRVTSITDPAGRVTMLGYDAAGNLTSITDPDLSSRSFDYDSRHHIVAETDQLGNHEETLYGFHGRAEGAIRKDGTALRFSPVQTRLLHSTAATRIPYSAPFAGLVTAETIAQTADGNGNVITTRLDQAGQTISSFDALGNLPLIARNDDNLVTSTTDARGFTTDFTYDDLGNLISISVDVSAVMGGGDGTFAAQLSFAVGSGVYSVAKGDFNGDGVTDLVTANFNSSDVSVLLGVGDGTFTAQQRYATGVLPTSVTTGDFNGDGVTDLAITSFISDDVSVLRGQGSAPGGQPQTFTYDPLYNQLASTTDELGRQTLFTIDPANGNRLSMTRVIGQVDSAGNGETDELLTTFTYTAQGLIELITDPLGRVTDFDYDAFGRGERITFAVGTPDEAFQLFEYDAAGNQTAIVDENGNRTELAYDNLDRLTQITEADPDGGGPLTSPVTAFTYDDRGNLTETTDAAGSTVTNEYDALDRLILTRDDLTNETIFKYDPDGNLIAVTDPNGNQTGSIYDARDRRTASTDPDGGVTTFRYGSDNDLLFLTDSNGNRTRFAYDARSRLVREEDPLGAEILYTHDAVDNLTEKTDRNGRRTEFVYDDLDRLTGEHWLNPDDSVANTVDYTYDDVGNLLTITDTTSALAFTYDDRDRVTSVDNAGTLTGSGLPNVVLTYAYDDVGNVTSVAESIDAAPAATTSYQYDALNRMKSVQQSGSGVTDKLVDMVYNQLGQFDEISRYSDLARGSLVARSDYTYDALNRLMALEHGSLIDPRDLAFYDFEYDAASRITAQTDVVDGWREHRDDGGVVIDVETDEIVAEGLSMPHSPRWYHDRLWLLDSGNGYFGYLDAASGKFEQVAFCPGFARGLAFVGDYAVVGLSLPRHDPTFEGLPLHEKLGAAGVSARCGLLVIDLTSGDAVEWLRLEEPVRELYDILALPGVRRPRLVGFQTDEIRTRVWADPEGLK